MSAAVRCLMGVGSALTRVVTSLPVLLVVCLIGADWWSFTVDYAILHSDEHSYPALIAVVTAIFNVFLFLTLWSYYKTITTSSSVRENPPPADYYAKYRIYHPEQPIRVCARCQGQPKPLRAHRQRAGRALTSTSRSGCRPAACLIITPPCPRLALPCFACRLLHLRRVHSQDGSEQSTETAPQAEHLHRQP